MGDAPFAQPFTMNDDGFGRGGVDAAEDCPPYIAADPIAYVHKEANSEDAPEDAVRDNFMFGISESQFWIPELGGNSR